MAATFKIYQDAALTTPLTSLALAFSSDGSDGAKDAVVYLGSTTAGKKLQKASAPGVDNIVASIADANGATGQLAADIKLALTQTALTAAIGGASLNLGVQVLSGVANAVPIWVRVNPSNLAIANYSDLSVNLLGVAESLV